MQNAQLWLKTVSIYSSFTMNEWLAIVIAVSVLVVQFCRLLTLLTCCLECVIALCESDFDRKSAAWLFFAFVTALASACLAFHSNYSHERFGKSAWPRGQCYWDTAQNSHVSKAKNTPGNVVYQRTGVKLILRVVCLPDQPQH